MLTLLDRIVVLKETMDTLSKEHKERAKIPNLPSAITDYLDGKADAYSVVSEILEGIIKKGGN